MYLFLSPSRSSSASLIPVDAPDGTRALPLAPVASSTSTCKVGFPRESRISKAFRLVIADINSLETEKNGRGTAAWRTLAAGHADRRPQPQRTTAGKPLRRSRRECRRLRCVRTSQASLVFFRTPVNRCAPAAVGGRFQAWPWGLAVRPTAGNEGGLAAASLPPRRPRREPGLRAQSTPKPPAVEWELLLRVVPHLPDKVLVKIGSWRSLPSGRLWTTSAEAA